MTVDEKQIGNVVSYWLKTAEEAYETMTSLFAQTLCGLLILWTSSFRKNFESVGGQ